MIELRAARPADLPAIVRLLADDPLGAARERFEQPLPRAYLEAFDSIRAQAGNEVVVAVDGGEVIGCLQLTVIPGLSRQGMKRGQIEGVRVDRRQRGKGVGEALVGRAIARARGRLRPGPADHGQVPPRRAALLRAPRVRRQPRGHEAGAVGSGTRMIGCYGLGHPAWALNVFCVGRPGQLVTAVASACADWRIVILSVAVMHRPFDRGLSVPSGETLLIFTTAALAMNISPGPSNLYVMSRSIAQGPGAGVVSATGLATGSLVHVVAAAFGLSVIFQVSATAYTLLKLAGAAYLIWLGIGYIRKGPSTAPTLARVPHGSRLRIFRESALVEILNPKTALFFLALLPQFVETAAGPVVPQVLLLGLIVTLTAIPCDLLVAFVSGSLARVVLRRPIYWRVQGWMAGSVLIALGVWVAASRRAA